MKRFSKRTLVVASTITAAITVGGVAFAYWTTTGAGTGSGTAATSNGTLVLHATFPQTGLFPGGSVAVSYTADNAGATDLQVGTVHAVVTTSPTSCLASDFSVADVVENQTIAHGTSGVALTNGGTLVFANSALNQDTCKGATITLTLTS